MKKEAGKKSKLWLWLLLALVAVAAAVAVVLFVLPGGGNQQEETPGEATVQSDIYWNIDGAYFTEISEVSGTSAREIGEDGFYHIAFLVNGERKELLVADKRLVNYIDSLQLMGLQFDENGYVIDALDIKTVATEIAKEFYVKKLENGILEINSSRAMNGMPLQLTVDENTIISDMTLEGDELGKAATPGQMDKVLVYQSLDGTKTFVYIVEHAPEPKDVYWRVERCWDATAGKTTREPDKNGVYTLEFACDGEIVELKCKDAAVIGTIDSSAVLTGQFSFEFDEEGYITAIVNVAIATNSIYAAGDYHVTGIEGDTVTFTRLSSGNDQGKVVTLKLAEDCKIFQCCQYACYDDHCGQRVDSVQVGDRVNVYSNLDNEANLIFVTRRLYGGPMYYNFNRQYGGNMKVGTLREKTGGYYVFEMLCEGKVVKVKVKDKKLADQMESIYNRCMGLDVNEKGVVTRLYDATCVYGGAVLGTESYVTELSGPVITIASSSSTSTWNSMLSPTCKVYNVIQGEYGAKVGGELTLQLGDQITAFRNNESQLEIVFVLSRPVNGGKVYYNLQRKYNSTTQETNRVPNEEGYYEYLFACEGKQVTGKTKSKGMASFIDAQTAPLVGLKINKNGIITNAYAVASVLKQQVKSCNYRYVEKVTKKSFNTYYYPSATPDKKVVDDTTWTIAKNCKVYNVSTAVESFRGEKATLKNGDYIQAIRDLKTNEITQIWIMTRNPAYGVKNYEAYCEHCQKTVTWEPYIGKVTSGVKHYFLFTDMFYPQAGVGTKAEDDATFDTVLDLNGKTLNGDGRCFLVYDHLTIMDSKGGGKLMGTNPSSSGDKHSGGCIMVAGGKLDILGGTLGQSEKSTAFGTMAGVLYVGGAGVEVNMYGGTLLGGTSTTNGGCVGIYGGTFNLYGGEIKGGTSPLGANIYSSSGNLNLMGGTVDGGIEVSASTTLKLSGKLTITGTGIKIPAGKKLDLSKLDLESRIAVQATGVFTEAYDNIADYQPIFTPGMAEDKIILRDNTLRYISSGPSDFVLDTDNDGMALCPVCNQEVAWTPVTGRLGTSLNGHYYVNANINDNSSQWATVTAKDAVLCIHLNGYNVTTSGRIATVGSGGTINIMGDGTIIGEGDYVGTDAESYTKATLNASTGPINLYGNVKVTTTAAGKPVVYNRVGFSLNDNAVIEGGEDSLGIENEKATATLNGGTITGGILANGGTIVLGGNTKVDIVGIQTSAKLKVLGSWTGAADSIFTNPLVDGIVPEANGISTGEFTGILNALDLETGEPTRLYGKSGRLCTENAQVTPPEPDFVLDPDGDNKAVCPVCGGAEVEWTPLEAGKSIGTSKSGHYYLLDSSINTDPQFATTTQKTQTICLHMNGKDLTTEGRIAIVGNGGNINIMGKGTITSNATSAYSEATLIAGSGGTVTVCDQVTIAITAEGKPAVEVRKSSYLILKDKATVIAQDGGVGIKVIGKLTVDGSWSGSAPATFEAALVEGVVPAANGASTGAFTGSLTTAGQKLVGHDGKLMLESAVPSEPVDPPTPPTPPAPEEELVLDADGNGYCEACEKTVKWTDLHTTQYNRIGWIQDEEGTDNHYHFYLSADLDNTMDLQFAELYRNTTCLHLNGHTLKIRTRIRLGASAVMHVLGSGEITTDSTATNASYNNALFYLNTGAVLNIYGSTVEALSEGVPSIFINDTKATAINLYGKSAVKGFAQLKNGVITLKDAADAEEIRVETPAKLVVDASWSGTAKAVFSAALVDGVVPAANGASTGSFTGSLTAGEQKLIGSDGKLMVDKVNPEVAKGNAVAVAAAAMDFSAYQAGTLVKCPACEKEVTWEAINGMGKSVEDGGHYYVAKDITGDGIFLTVSGKKVCVHLNGKTLSYGARIFATSASTANPGTLNLMGSGTVSSSNSHGDYGTGTIHASSAGIINLYGGTYKSTGANTKATIHTTGGTVNLYAGATVDSNTGTNVLLEKGTVNLYGGTIKNGTGYLSGSNRLGGNVYLKSTGSVLNIVDGTITGGTATYGGNIRGEAGTTITMDGGVIGGTPEEGVTRGNATGGGGNVNSNGTFTMNGGTLSGGTTAGNGGNILSKGTVTIGKAATVCSGTAKEGGNIMMNADSGKTSTLHMAGTVYGGTTAGSAAHGGNISGGTGSVINITGGKIYGGVAAGQGGNVRTYNGTINITGGEIYGGTSQAASNHNVWVAGNNGVLVFTGGTVKGLDGTNASGTAINIGTNSKLYLGGTASAIREDGVHKGNIQVYNGKLFVLNDWTGTASVRFASGYTAGTTLADTVAQCGALEGGVFTAGGSYSGTLMNEQTDVVKILGAEGALVLDQLPAAE